VVVNNVLDIQEPTTFLQPLEINLLYQFHGEYSFLEPHILYSFKNKLPNICEPHIVIPPNSICAILSQNKIIPYKTYVMPTSHQELLILKDDVGDQFFVTFEKSKGHFINIARGRQVSEKEFPDYIECIWEAYNLQGWKKSYWEIKSLLTRAYVKYIFYVVKIVTYLVLRIVSPVFKVSYYIDLKIKSDNLYVRSFVSFLCLIFCAIYLPTLFVAGYSLFFFWYYATMLPFFVLTFPLNFFIFGLNWYTFVFVPQGLASLYVCCFPLIKKCMPFSSGEIEQITIEKILPNIIKSFNIKPKKIMSVVPLLVQNRKNCWVECSDTIIMSFLIFLFGFPLLYVFLVLWYIDGNFENK
jgi:hypothetical protein